MKKKKYLPKEESIQKTLCQYIKLKWPGVWFRCDLGGLRIPIGQAVKVKKCSFGRGFPDFFLPLRTERYNGLFIEIKKSFNEVYTQKGVLRNNEHLREQLQCLEYLQGQGFKTKFGYGLDDCILTIDEYMKDIG